MFIVRDKIGGEILIALPPERVMAVEPNVTRIIHPDRDDEVIVRTVVRYLGQGNETDSRTTAEPIEDVVERLVFARMATEDLHQQANRQGGGFWAWFKAETEAP